MTKLTRRQILTRLPFLGLQSGRAPQKPNVILCLIDDLWMDGSGLLWKRLLQDAEHRSFHGPEFEVQAGLLAVYGVLAFAGGDSDWQVSGMRQVQKEWLARMLLDELQSFVAFAVGQILALRTIRQRLDSVGKSISVAAREMSHPDSYRSPDTPDKTARRQGAICRWRVELYNLNTKSELRCRETEGSLVRGPVGLGRLSLIPFLDRLKDST